ncbi:MAG TPA: hypothetical protein PLN52_08700 [Opitutaceae bacterium]|nr:hypothetical protein [Opitutaceae bacterium]
MSSSPDSVSSSVTRSGTREQYIRVRIKPLDIPPIKDGLVIGVRAAIGADAMQRTLQLVSNEKFELIAFKEDEIVSHALVRLAILKKVSKAKMMDFILARLKPLMTEGEILMLDIDVEMVVEDKL